MNQETDSDNPGVQLSNRSEAIRSMAHRGGRIGYADYLMQEHDCGNDVVVFSPLGTLKRPYQFSKGDR